jgi:hypothetical protein
VRIIDIIAKEKNKKELLKYLFKCIVLISPVLMSTVIINVDCSGAKSNIPLNSEGANKTRQ